MHDMTKTTIPQPLGTSMFYMWRALVALAHADGQMGQEEIDYFRKLFDTLPRHYELTVAQREAFADDLMNPKQIDLMLPFINDPEVRKMLLDYAEMLAWIDGVLDPREEDILKRLHQVASPEYDQSELAAELRARLRDSRAQYQAELEQMRKDMHQRSPWLIPMDSLLQKCGIDMLD